MASYQGNQNPIERGTSKSTIMIDYITVMTETNKGCKEKFHITRSGWLCPDILPRVGDFEMSLKYWTEIIVKWMRMVWTRVKLCKSLYDGEKWHGIPRLENRFAGQGVHRAKYKLREVGRYMCVMLKFVNFIWKIMVKHSRFSTLERTFCW